MKAMLTRWAGWFNDARRQAVQALVSSTVALLVVLGAVSDVQSSALLDLSASLLLAVQGALGLFLLRAGDRYTWVNTTGRGLIYSLGGALGAAGFAFGLFSDSTSSLIVQVATVLASILVGAVQMVNAGTLTAADPVDDDRLATVAESRAAEEASAARPIEASPATFKTERVPTPGRVVLYQLSQRDAEQIEFDRNQRTGAPGNTPRAGDIVPAIVVRVWPDGINAKAVLDGADSLWLTSRKQGTTPGTWAWPTVG